MLVIWSRGGRSSRLHTWTQALGRGKETWYYSKPHEAHRMLTATPESDKHPRWQLVAACGGMLPGMEAVAEKIPHTPKVTE
jgi:hypothetical protein